MVATKSAVAAACICMTWCLWVGHPAQAGESESVKSGYYLGAMFAHNSMDGDFDDTIVLDAQADVDVFDVPDVDDGEGFTLVIGRRFDKISLEFGYQNTAHDTTSVLVGDSEATYSVFDLNVKIDVFARGRLRPYVLLGAGFPWLDIEDSRSHDDGATWTRDAEFRGYCLNAGVGLAYYFDPQWAVMGGLIHRWNTFNHVKGLRIDDDLLERSLGFTIGIAYTF